jgi:AcrR family transcriptional regulator
VVHKLAEETRLAVSERCCVYFMAEGTTQRPVADIAAAAGISERTFHRYFPVKAESVYPVFEAMTARKNAFVIAHPHLPMRELLAGAFESMFASPVTARASELFPLVFADPEMWALFLRKVHDGETSLAPLLAERLGIPAEDDRARAAAAAVASSIRIALERLSATGPNSAKSADIAATFIRMIDAFGSALFEAAPSPHETHERNEE